MCEQRNRILIVGPLPPAVGGIATFICGVLGSDLNKEYDFIAFGTARPTIGFSRDVDNYTLMFRIGAIRFAKSITSTLSHLIRFPYVVIMKRPDIVHIHTASYWSFWENAVYSLISKLFKKKVIIHIHGGLFDKFYKRSNIFAKSSIRRVLQIPDKIIVLSSKWKNSLAGIIPEDKIVVLENFVNFEKFTHLDRESDLSRDAVNVLFVGGVGAKAKGIFDVLKAIPIVVEESKNIMFCFVACGDVDIVGIFGNNEQYMSHAKFLDYLSSDRKIKVLYSSDIFVLPSYSEGLPITMLEAMAAGLPVIATSVGSIPEVIEEGKNGFLIEVGNYYALAEKILILARDKRLRWRMGKNNVNKIRKYYDRRIAVRKLDNLYARLLGGQIV